MGIHEFETVDFTAFPTPSAWDDREPRSPALRGTEIGPETIISPFSEFLIVYGPIVSKR